MVVAVSSDEDARKYRRFLRDHKVSVDTYRDPARAISRSYGTYMYPETYIIQDGQIIRKVVGPIDWTTVEIDSFVRARLAGAAHLPPPA